MKNHSFSDLVNRTLTGEEQFYDCEEVDARIAELEKALREAIKWNWAKYAPPHEAEALVNNALGL